MPAPLIMPPSLMRRDSKGAPREPGLVRSLHLLVLNWHFWRQLAEKTDNVHLGRNVGSGLEVLCHDLEGSRRVLGISNERVELLVWSEETMADRLNVKDHHDVAGEQDVVDGASDEVENSSNKHKKGVCSDEEVQDCRGYSV